MASINCLVVSSVAAGSVEINISVTNSGAVSI